MNMNFSRLYSHLKNKQTSLFLILMILLTILLYLPGLLGYFSFDDFPNIVSNPDVHLENLTIADIKQSILSGISSDIGRPVSMLSLAINYYFSGLTPFAYKATNLALHCFTGILVFLFCKEVLRTQTLNNVSTKLTSAFPLLIAAWWLLHPLNVSTTLYIVQRMTQLSAISILAGLIVYCRFRSAQAPDARTAVRTFLLLLGILIFGVLCKENAVLLVPLIVVTEFFLYQNTILTENHKRFFKLFIPSMLVLPAIGAVVILILDPTKIIGDYSFRDFTLIERLLTQARVLSDYLHWIILPNSNDLVLYHENIEISKSLVNPPVTLVSISILSLLIFLAFITRKTIPLLGYGVMFFFTSHLLESTVVALEMSFEHRNYLPGIGILISLASVFFFYIKHISLQSRLLITLSFTVFLAHGTYVENQKWSNPITHLTKIRLHNPNSYRINYSLGSYLLNISEKTPDNAELLDLSIHYFEQSATYETGTTSVLARFAYLVSISQSQQVPDPAHINSIIEYLSSRDARFIYRAVPSIADALNCTYSGSCNLSPAIFGKIFNAIAENNQIPAKQKQGILAIYADLIALKFNQLEDSRAILELAKSLTTDISHIDLKLIKIDYALGNKTRALQNLIELQRLDIDEDLQKLVDESIREWNQDVQQE